MHLLLPELLLPLLRREPARGRLRRGLGGAAPAAAEDSAGKVRNALPLQPFRQHVAAAEAALTAAAAKDAILR